jgi:hypothetical protein
VEKGALSEEDYSLRLHAYVDTKLVAERLRYYAVMWIVDGSAFYLRELATNELGASAVASLAEARDRILAAPDGEVAP